MRNAGGPMIFKNREHTVFFSVLFFLLIVISVQVRTANHATILEKIFYHAISPYLKAGNSAIESLRSAASHVNNLKNALEENRKLKSEIIDLKNEIQLTDFLMAQNSELRELLQYKKIFVPGTTAADIVSRDIANPYRALILNKGSSSGISRDMAVIVPEGIIGRIIQTSGGTAKVQLITDADSGIAAFHPGTGENTIVVGLNSGILEARYVPNTSSIKTGDKLVSSGYDGIYPEGLNVGTVSVSEPGQFGTRIINVIPAADITGAKELLIITGDHEQN